MRKTITLPDVNYLNECFCLLENGLLIWKARPSSHFGNIREYKTFNKKYLGRVAGCKRNDGYMGIFIFKKMFKAHRIIYRMAHGEIPDGFEVDHINGDHTDNSPANLRLASSSQNCQNRKNRSDNISGVKGVWFCNTRKKFIAQIMSFGVEKKECFASLQDAEKWIVEVRKEMHGNFANNGTHTGELK